MTQHPLANPYGHVHPFFWPVLWLSLRAFVAWSGKMIEEGHGFAGLAVELTWYGVIRVRAIDLSKERAAFHRHMMGAPREDGWGVLADAARRVERIVASNDAANPCAGRGPWTILAASAPVATNDPWIPAFAGICGTQRHVPNGAGPPLATAPLPQSGRGAALSFARISSPPHGPAAAGAGARRNVAGRVRPHGERRRTMACVPVSILRLRSG